jgi:hypothetical protein
MSKGPAEGTVDVREKTYFRYRMRQRQQKEETQPKLRLG